MKHNQSIKKRYKDQVVKTAVRATGSFFVALSGFILFSDKIISFQLKNNYGFADTETFIWVMSQSLSPIILIISNVLKPYKTSYAVPLYMYVVQMYWVFSPDIRFDNILLQTYAIGSVMLFLVLLYIIRKSKLIRDNRAEENKEILKESLELIKIIKNEEKESN